MKQSQQHGYYLRFFHQVDFPLEEFFFDPWRPKFAGVEILRENAANCPLHPIFFAQRSLLKPSTTMCRPPFFRSQGGSRIPRRASDSLRRAGPRIFEPRSVVVQVDLSQGDKAQIHLRQMSLPESRLSASMYRARVFSTTSSGSSGAGSVFFHPLDFK